MSRRPLLSHRRRALRAVTVLFVVGIPPTAASGFELIGASWPDHAATFWINPNFPEEALAGSADRQIELILCGAAAWRDQTRADFQFIYEGTTNRSSFNSRDGVNIVAWSAADGGDALAATIVAGDKGVATAFDVLFFDTTNNETNHWTSSGEPAPGQLDIVGVATHELGHALGLNHSATQQATMFASVSGRGLPLRTLHSDDRAGVESLYSTRAVGEPAVLISSVTPESGPNTGANEVVLEGLNFTYDADTQLLVDETPLSNTRWSVETCSRLRVTSMPSHAAGLVSLRLVNTIGSVTIEDAYRYVGASPRILAVNPVEGPLTGGISVTITGENLAADAVVTIGGQALLDAVVVDAATIEGRVPAGAAEGPVDVQLEQGTEVSVLDDAFTYNPYLILASDTKAPPGATDAPARVRVSSPVALQAMAFALSYDPLIVQATRAVTDGGGAAAAEFVGVNVQNDLGVTQVEIVMDPDGDAIVFPAGDDVLAATVFLDVLPNAVPGTVVPLGFDGSRGVPPVELSFTRETDGQKVRPLVLPGSLEVVDEPSFLRGDANGDTKRDVSDVIFSLDFLFKGGPGASCDDAVDSNDDGQIDISDAILLLGFLFQGVESLPAPYPGTGPDPTPDAIGCER